MLPDPLSRLPPDLDPANREILTGYIRHCRLRNIQETSIVGKLWRIYKMLKVLGFKPATAICKRDIEDYIIERRQAVSPVTLRGDVVELKIFFRFLDPAKEKEFFGTKMLQPKRAYPDPLNREEIASLVTACETIRDRALIMFLWDTGCRIDEALSLNLADIQIDQQCGHARLDGKTGEREAWLIDCLPDLQAWLNIHPFREKPGSPLFLTYTRFGFGTRRLNVRTVQNLCKTLQKRAGVTKRVHPHAFRHARATDRAKAGYTEMELRIVFGWSASSNMPAVYIHISGADVKQKMLQKAGLAPEPVAPGERPLDPAKCPRCKTLNPSGSLICSQCSLILDPRVAVAFEGKFTKLIQSAATHQVLAKTYSRR